MLYSGANEVWKFGMSRRGKGHSEYSDKCRCPVHDGGRYGASWRCSLSARREGILHGTGRAFTPANAASDIPMPPRRSLWTG